jgi:hypothetical protein
MKRNCGWLESRSQADTRPVWTRRNLHTTACPKPLIDSQSIAWIESFVVQKLLHFGIAAQMPAKDVDAFLLLDQLLAQEKAVARQQAEAAARMNKGIKC